MKHPMIRNSLILAASGIFAKSFDFIFRAYYSRMLTAEGMGLLSLGFSLHGVLITVCTAGFGVAVSKVVSERLEQKDYAAVWQSMRYALGCVAGIGLCLTAIIFFGAEGIAENVLGDVRIAPGLCALVPSVLFMGISYCLKGYFYAARKVIVPAFSEILEQAVKFVSISLLLKFLLPKGIAYGCAAVFGGISIGECSSCLFLSLFYWREQKQGEATGESKLFRSLMQVAIPAMLTALIDSVLRMLEEVQIVAAYQRFGMAHGEAVSTLGVVCGMTMPMLIFPLTLLGSVTTLLIPEVSRRNSDLGKPRLRALIKKVYPIGIGAGALVFAALELFPNQICNLVYHTDVMADTVRILAILSPVMFLDSLSCAILGGMGRQVTLLFVSIADSLLRLGAIWVFVPIFGTPALLAVILCSHLFVGIITVAAVRKRIL